MYLNNTSAFFSIHHPHFFPCLFPKLLICPSFPTSPSSLWPHFLCFLSFSPSLYLLFEQLYATVYSFLLGLGYELHSGIWTYYSCCCFRTYMKWGGNITGTQWKIPTLQLHEILKALCTVQVIHPIWSQTWRQQR